MLVRSTSRIALFSALSAFGFSLAVHAADSPANAGISAGVFSATDGAIDVALSGGRGIAVWSDNSSALPGNPDVPKFDIAASQLTLNADGGFTAGANVNVTRALGSQFAFGTAIDPTNANNVVIVGLSEELTFGVRDLIVATSANGGTSFSRRIISQTAFTPQVAFDSFGNCFVSYLDAEFDPYQPTAKLLVSRDKCQSFATAFTSEGSIGIALAAGPGGVHLALGVFGQGLTLASFRTDAAGSVTAVGRRLVATGNHRTPGVAVGGDGQVIVGFEANIPGACSLFVRTDADGFGAQDFGSLSQVANSRCFGFSLAYDRSDGVHAGRVYLASVDQFGSLNVRNQSTALLRFSDDNGATWSAAIPVSDNVNTLRASAEVAVDSASGRTAVVWLDARNRANAFETTNIFRVFGRTFAQPVATNLPASPSNLNADGATRGRVTLNWADRSNNETGFQIERAIVEFEGFQPVATVGADTTAFSDTSLPDFVDGLFVYRVRAVNVAGVSTDTNETLVIASGANTALPAPSNAVATANSSSRITLTWRDNSTSEGGFLIERSSDGVNFTGLVAVPANTTSFVDRELQSNSRFFYRVFATGPNLRSDPSNIASARTLAPAAPTAPSNLTASSSRTSIALRWRDNSNNETRFEIQRSTDGVNFEPIRFTGANVTSFTDSGLQANRTYFYRVRAVNGDFHGEGFSGFTNLASATTGRR